MSVWRFAISDAEISASQPRGHRRSERVGQRGDGSIMIRWGSGQTRLFYWRWFDGQQQRALPLPVRSMGEAREFVRSADRASRDEIVDLHIRSVTLKEIARTMRRIKGLR
jgi:hypothetical protein